ncbi:MAG: tetratricopeptide repeat protein, partial [Desulfobulbus sp.]|nr:tetratricopeptide repeat protein [Desulfobulbus sp.]
MTHKISTKSQELALDETFDKAYRQFQANRLSDAEDSYRRILDAHPENPRALHALGAVSYRQGKREQAIMLILRALERKPDFADAHNNLGNIYKDEGDLDKAAECYQTALTINEKHPLALHNLGIIYLNRRKPEKALELFSSALAIAPDYAEAYVHQGNALADLGQFDRAANSYEKAIELRPDYAIAHFNYGNALKKQGCMSDAVLCYRNALKIRSNYPEALMNLGNALISQGLIEEAITQYRKALEIEPANFGVHSNILFCLNYLPNITKEALYRESLCWAETHEKHRSVNIKTHENDCNPTRRLRIGYVSPDFRVHSVSYFCLPLFSSHDRGRVELFCYGEVSRPDMTTARIEKLADVWVDTVGMTDQELAERIRSDRIDILVDLAGHTAKNRLTVFAEKPAPVQITWLGYPGTTGLSSIDYRITDSIADPPEASRHHTETLLRLADGFLCYEPSGDAPPVATLPFEKNPGVTFGSFNNPAKITTDVLDLWASLLKTIPFSRLILKSHSFSDEPTRLSYLKPFLKQGIDPFRLEFLPAENRKKDHLALYGRIDISLDPFPYNGTTTTCESLWMGVPVITLCGDRHAERVGASLLSSVGLEELIAYDKEEYLRIACQLTSEPAKLARPRSSLRK